MDNQQQQPNYRTAFRRRLRQLRAEKGVGSSEVSELCGLASCAVYRYENGAWVPNAKSLCALADYFDCSVDYLLGRTDRRK